MNFRYENQGTSIFLVCELEADEQIDELSMGMLKNNQIPGILPVSFVQMDAKRYLRWNVSSKVNLASFLGKKISKKHLLTIFSSICSAFIVTEDYLMDNDQFLLSQKYMYCDVSSGTTSLIYLPVIRETVPADLNMLMKSILVGVNFEDEEDTGYIMVLMNRLNHQSNIPAAELKELIETLRKPADQCKSADPDNREESDEIKEDTPAEREKPDRVKEDIPAAREKSDRVKDAGSSEYEERRSPAGEHKGSEPSSVRAEVHNENLSKEPEENFAYNQNTSGQSFEQNGYFSGAQGNQPWEAFSDPAKQETNFQNGSVPGQMYQDGPMPGQMYQNSPMPGQIYQDGPMPGQMYQDGPMPGQMYQDGPMPGQMYQDGPIPGQMYQENPMPGQMYQDEYMQRTIGPEYSMNNAQPADFNGKAEPVKKGIFGFGKKNRFGKKETPAAVREQNINNFSNPYPGMGNSGQISGFGEMPANPYPGIGNSGQISGFGEMPANPYPGMGNSGQISGFGEMPANPYPGIGNSGQINGFGEIPANPYPGMGNSGQISGFGEMAANPYPGMGNSGQISGFGEMPGNPQNFESGQAQFSNLDSTMPGHMQRDFQMAGSPNRQPEYNRAAVFDADEETTVLAHDSDLGEPEISRAGRQVSGAEYQPVAALKRKKNGKTMDIRKDVFHIGREERYADFCIPDNIAVSKNHANIICRDKKFFIKDMNSLNHTYLNGEMLTSNTEYELRSGDSILLANEEFEFFIR